MNKLKEEKWMRRKKKCAPLSAFQEKSVPVTGVQSNTKRERNEKDESEQ